MALECKKHPKYKGLKQPKVPCEMCWVIYLGISEMCLNCGCQENNCPNTGEVE